MMALVAVMTLVALRAVASPAAPRANMGVSESEPLTASLITCWPGAEVYELCGHEALRIRGEGIDSVWNYGVFDFNQPNFIYRFVKGETDYMLVGYPFAWFMPEYMAYGRKVVEQDLNLTPDEVARLRKILQRESLPDRRTYRYNYVKDNCSTRILDRIDETLGVPVVYNDSVHYGTFRREMMHYHRDYPWYQFGIDLALGSGIDYQLTGKEEMFVPMEMMRKVSSAKIADGRQLVSETRVLYEGMSDATLGPTPLFLTPMAFSIAVAALVLLLIIYDIVRKRETRWAYSLFYAILGVVGCVCFFLVFISEHEATSPNTLILWLNPLQLIAAIFLWWRTTRGAALAVAYYDMVAVACMLIVWPCQHQQANPAIFPLAGATLVLSAAYIFLTSKYGGSVGKIAPGTKRKQVKSGRKTRK